MAKSLEEAVNDVLDELMKEDPRITETMAATTAAAAIDQLVREIHRLHTILDICPLGLLTQFVEQGKRHLIQINDYGPNEALGFEATLGVLAHAKTLRDTLRSFERMIQEHTLKGDQYASEPSTQSENGAGLH